MNRNLSNNYTCFLFIVTISCFLQVGHLHSHYDKHSNQWIRQIEEAQSNHKECVFDDCRCYESQIARDIAPFVNGVNESMIRLASERGVRYQIIDSRLFRQQRCPFEARCEGVEHFLLKLLDDLPDMEFVVNVYDSPQVGFNEHPLPVFSFSKDSQHIDILYPAWSFWSGGPAISLYPTGIGNWNETASNILNKADDIEWNQRKSIAFFRGSRTNAVRDRLILLARRSPSQLDARYTKNQAWRSIKDTLGEEPAKEVSFEEHCNYKYLLNLAGVAASFRLRHLLLCGSVVLNVGHEWIEFFYGSLKPWIHYVPVSEELLELHKLIEFAKEHDQIMHQIGSRGRSFVESHLRVDDVLCYWRLLLKNYSKLITYRIQRVSSFKRIL